MSKESEALTRIAHGYIDTDDIATLRKAVKALENISKAYGNYANYKISEYELIMAVSENIT